MRCWAFNMGTLHRRKIRYDKLNKVIARVTDPELKSSLIKTRDEYWDRIQQLNIPDYTDEDYEQIHKEHDRIDELLRKWETDFNDKDTEISDQEENAMKNNDKYESNMEDIEKEYATDNEDEGADENEDKTEYEDDDAYDDEDEEEDDFEAWQAVMDHACHSDAYLIRPNLNPAITVPEKHTTEICFAMRLAEGCTLRDYMTELFKDFRTNFSKTPEQYRLPGGNYYIKLILRKTGPDEDGYTYKDQIGVEYSQAGEFVVGRIHYTMRHIIDTRDDSQFWTEPAPILAEDIWNHYVEPLFELYTDRQVTNIRNYGRIMTGSVEKLASWLKVHGTELPKDTFTQPEPIYCTTSKGYYILETENTDQDYIEEFTKQFDRYEQVESDSSIFFFNSVTLETVEICDGQLRMAVTPETLHAVTLFFEDRGWVLRNLTCSQKDRLELEGYHRFLEGLAIYRVKMNVLSPTEEYAADQEQQDDVFRTEYVLKEAWLKMRVPVFRYNFILGKNSPEKELENLWLALNRWKKKVEKVTVTKNKEEREKYLKEYVSRFEKALQYAGVSTEIKAKESAKAQIFITINKLPSNVKGRVESMKDPEFQRLKKAWMNEMDPEIKEQKEQAMWKRMDELMKVRDAEDEEMRTMGPKDLNQSLFRDIAQAVVDEMIKHGVIKIPELTYLYNEAGVLDRMFRQNSKDPNILALKDKPNDLYLIIIGMHAFGAGIYATCMQNEFNHFADEFTHEDIDKIFTAFHLVDAYQLSLDQMKIPLDSNNKKILDAVILAGMRAAKASAGDALYEPKNIHTYMQVLFNAGNTLVMRGKCS